MLERVSCNLHWVDRLLRRAYTCGYNVLVLGIDEHLYAAGAATRCWDDKLALRRTFATGGIIVGDGAIVGCVVS